MCSNSSRDDGHAAGDRGHLVGSDYLETDRPVVRVRDDVEQLVGEGEDLVPVRHAGQCMSSRQPQLRRGCLRPLPRLLLPVVRGTRHGMRRPRARCAGSRPSASQERLRRRPSIPTRLPLPRYSLQSSAWRSQTLMWTKSASASFDGLLIASRKPATCFLVSDSLQLDVRGEVPDQAHDVHASTVAGKSPHVCSNRAPKVFAANL